MTPRPDTLLSAFGAAVAAGQMVEMFLAALVSVDERRQSGVNREKWLGRLEALDAKTLGGLRSELIGRRVSAPVIDDIEPLLRQRNFLVHHYFRDPKVALLLQTKTGRRTAIAGLRRDEEAFHALARKLKDAMIGVAVEEGVTAESAVERLDQLAELAPTQQVREKVSALLAGVSRDELEDIVRDAFGGDAQAPEGEDNTGPNRTTRLP